MRKQTPHICDCSPRCHLAKDTNNLQSYHQTTEQLHSQAVRLNSSSTSLHKTVKESFLCFVISLKGNSFSIHNNVGRDPSAMHNIRKIMCFLKIKVCTSILPGKYEPENYHYMNSLRWSPAGSGFIFSIQWYGVFSILFLTALCPACFSCMPAKFAQWNHVLDVSLSQHICFKWSACHQALLKADSNPFTWIRCFKPGTHLEHASIEHIQLTKI